MSEHTPPPGYKPGPRWEIPATEGAGDLKTMLASCQAANLLLAELGEVANVQLEVIDAYTEPRVAIIVSYVCGVRLELTGELMESRVD